MIEKKKLTGSLIAAFALDQAIRHDVHWKVLKFAAEKLTPHMNVMQQSAEPWMHEQARLGRVVGGGMITPFQAYDDHDSGLANEADQGWSFLRHPLGIFASHYEVIKNTYGTEQGVLTFYAVTGGWRAIRALHREISTFALPVPEGVIAIYTPTQYSDAQSFTSGRSFTGYSLPKLKKHGIKKQYRISPVGIAEWDGKYVPGREMNTVAGDHEVLTQLLEDARGFFQDREWFETRGIPWRRGYLLSGPPGGGKTTLVTALATELKKPVFIYSPTSSAEIRKIISMLPPESILLFEDIDALGISRPKEGAEVKIGKDIPATFSEMLNVLDGIGGIQGVLVIATSNYPERLDPALTRPGRIDRQFELGYATPAVAAQILSRIFPELRTEIGSMTPPTWEKQITPAQVQEIAITHLREPSKAIEEVFGFN